MLVSARKLNQLGVVDAELEPPRPVEETARALSAPSCRRVGPELATGDGRSAGSLPPGSWCPGPAPSARPAEHACGGQGTVR